MRGSDCKPLCELKAEVAGKHGPNGKALCCWCKTEIPKHRRNWCSDKCVEQYKLQNDWTYICRLVKKRDHAICGACGIDTAALRKALHEMAKRFGWKAAQQYAATMKIPASRITGRRLWDADHVIPCDEGGTSDLSNLQTLCITCHVAKTTEQRRRKHDGKRK